MSRKENTGSTLRTNVCIRTLGKVYYKKEGAEVLYYEIRDPVHGFIQITEWERQIIDDPVFQRLRRIRQLAWTDMVYPGACHNRFEHSLGVMHVATKIFDTITRKEEKYLKEELNFTDHGLDRDRVLLRLACLLHDVGHSPFSHAGEGLLLTNPDTGKSYKHEHYSAAAARYLLKDLCSTGKKAGGNSN